MIKKAVENWETNKDKIREYFVKQHPSNYFDIVKNVVYNITDSEGYDFKLDSENIHEIDDGDYQGTLLYIIPAKEYQPSNYWSVKVYYGSCSGCDTLQAIKGETFWEEDKPPTENQIEQYMTLSLHIVQGLKEV
jgi:hypothetical protein